MKKGLLIALLSASMLVAGCGKTEVKGVSEIKVSEETKAEVKNDTEVESDEALVETDSVFSKLENMEFYFASGAGAWRTVMQIEADGSFSGQYSDSDMGSTGEGYPNGTCYLSNFEGKFTQPVKINEYTYSMEIEEINYEKTGTEEIIDGVLYCYGDAYGLAGAEEVLIYLPGAPTTELPEEYMNWVHNDMKNPDALELPFYGLYNVAEQNGFSSYDISDRIADMMAATEEWALTIRASLENDTLTQADMNIKSMELYETWDAALNALWTELKDQMSEEEFTVLLDEQRAWISEKEAAVKEAGKEVEGGSMYSLVVNMKAAEITEERVHELYELLK